MRAQIGSYRIEQILGRGGMGEVYKGYHDGLRRHAAIKTFLRTGATTSVQRKRLTAEAQAQAALQHRNIVTVYDLIEDQGELFIAMEYVEGKPLSEILAEATSGRIPPAEALPLIEQILDALEYVHFRSIVHRDVKPSNVMICEGRVKLMDFGIALLAGNPHLSMHLTAAGTPSYMSPEQLRSKQVDCRSDIYSAAIVLFQMLAGRLPFPAKEPFAQIHERLAGAPDLQSIEPDLPPGICRAVAIALSYEPRDRFQTAAQFREALKDGGSGLLPIVGVEPGVDPEATIPAAVFTTPPPAPPTPPETSTLATAAMWVAVASSLGVVSYVAVNPPNRQMATQVSPPAGKPTPPDQNSIPVTAPPEQKQPAKTPPKKHNPKLEPKPSRVPRQFPEAVFRPPQNESEKQRHELEALRTEMRIGLMRAAMEIELERFAEGSSELDLVVEKIGRHPVEFTAEAQEVKALRARLEVARHAANDRKQWQKRIAPIEAALLKGKWPEVQTIAEQIISENPPEPYLSQTKDLLQKGKDGHVESFKDMKVSPTANDLVGKKPSPPRNEP